MIKSYDYVNKYNYKFLSRFKIEIYKNKFILFGKKKFLSRK